MKLFFINTYDERGGAARAAYRIHQAVRHAGVDSRMIVDVAESGDWTVTGLLTKMAKASRQAKLVLGSIPCRFLRTTNPILHSSAFLSSGRVKELNNSDADLLHLHWINQEMLSIEDIAKLRKPLVWTLHDMWAFCGAEHYTKDHRWKEGYKKTNRPAFESGFDLNRWVWQRKRKLWEKPIHIVAPSNWLADCARQSALMQDWPVSVIANAINTDFWKPVDQNMAREILQLPTDVPLLLFGAMDGGKDPRKGFDLLEAALAHLRSEVKDLELVVFGQLPPKEPPDLGFPVHYMGHLHDDATMKLLYNAVDVMTIPSRQDNLPNTGVEAHACGKPVVGFDVGGLPDIVDHRVTGYLANPYDVLDLANGISYVFSKSADKNLNDASRRKAESSWSYNIISKKYLSLYRKYIDDF